MADTIPSAPAAASAATSATPAASSPAVVVPSEIPGVYTLPSADADDAMLAAARSMGISDQDLGIAAPAPATPAAPAATPSATPMVGEPAPGAQEVTPAPATPPADETPEQKIARLERENAELRTGKKPEEAAPAEAATPLELPPLTQPLPSQPLALLSKPEQLAFAEDVARQLRQWASANRDGGDMPATLFAQLEKSQAMVLGRQPQEIKDARYFDAAQSAELFEQADRMLTEHVPARRNFSAQEGHFLGEIRSKHAAMLDPQKPEGQTFAKIIQHYPALRQYPDWPMLVRDLTAGFLAHQAKPAVQTSAPVPAPISQPKPSAQVPSIHGGTVPLAPAAATSSAAPSGVPVSQARLDDAQRRLDDGTFTEADLILLSGAAV